MSNPISYFDALCLGQGMSDIVEGFARQELHLLSYASCLLSLYEGRPKAEWGYEFVSSENGIPYAQDIDEAITTTVSLGLIEPKGPLMVVTEDGKEELEVLSLLEVNKDRKRYLNGASEILLVFNPGSVREAFNYDPAISYLRKHNSTDWVLTDPVVDRLYANFQQLRSALDCNTKDLSVPLVSWLKYLILSGRSVHP
jgi:hypothetical protein